MNKLFIHLLITVCCFFALWFSLSQINFLSEDETNGFMKDQEKKLGELIMESIKETQKEIKSEKIKAILDSIGRTICEPNKIDYDSIKIHIVKNSEVNAFTLPDRHMIIYTGLIDYAKNPEEIAGVMAHEIGHMEKKHVMKKLVKEIGVAMLFTIVGGDAGFEITKETSRVLSSSAFDRSLEREADEFAVDMLAKANVDPESFGNIMFRLAKSQDLPEELVWISTHPDGKERSAEIFKKRKELKFTSKPIIKTPWEDVKKLVVESNDD
jgi:predicted Zn-dependent protease